MHFEMLEIAIADRIAVITINRPDVLNALSPDLLTELNMAVDEMEVDEKEKVDEKKVDEKGEFYRGRGFIEFRKSDEKRIANNRKRNRNDRKEQN